jgi:hypothetical protein
MLLKSEASIEQCRLNVVAILNYHRFPMYEDGQVSYSILLCLPDRVILRPSKGMSNYLFSNLVEAGTFKPALLDRKLHGPTAFWTMRETVPFGSNQITGHRGGTAPDYREVSWELDFDHGNPAYLSAHAGHQDLVSIFKGVAALMVHGAEVAYPGKTNPWWIRRRLVARGINVPLVAVPGEV